MMRPRAGSLAARRLARAVCVTAALALSLPTAAAGETATPTVQATSAMAEFLAYAPPPPRPSAVCIVGSGVDLNPDTRDNAHLDRAG